MDDIESMLTQEAIPYEEAEEYFSGKVPLSAKEFYKLAAEYRTLAFTVSNYTKAQILAKFQAALQSAIDNGTTLEQFRGDMNQFLTSEGYKGLTPFQAENIFRTNVQTAYNVGHYQKMTDPAVKKLRPYWRYDAVNDQHTRKSHLAMDGKVFPADSDVWDEWYPPNGFKCRCFVSTLSERQVREQGITVEDKVPRLDQLGDGRFVTVLPDPLFSTNPAKVPFQPDVSQFPPAIRTAYEREFKGTP